MMILIRLAHLLWEQGVVGSNPATPTDENKGVTVKCSSFFVARLGGCIDGLTSKFDSTIIFGVQGMFNPKGFLLLRINYGGLQ